MWVFTKNNQLKFSEHKPRGNGDAMLLIFTQALVTTSSKDYYTFLVRNHKAANSGGHEFCGSRDLISA